MRVVAEIPHHACKITVFSWNSKYIIKLEQGPLEQTYKISELDVAGEEDIKNILQGKFMEEALIRFKEMEQSLIDATSQF